MWVVTWPSHVQLNFNISQALYYFLQWLAWNQLVFYFSRRFNHFICLLFISRWHVVKIQSVEKWTLTHLFSLLYNLVSQSEECMYSVMLSKVSWSVNCLLKTLNLKGFSSVCTLWGKNTNDLNPLNRNISIHILHTVLC